MSRAGNDYNHNSICSAYIIGFEASSSNNEYDISTNCYGYSVGPTSQTINIRTLVKKTTQVSMLRMKIFTMDFISMDLTFSISV